MIDTVYALMEDEAYLYDRIVKQGKYFYSDFNQHLDVVEKLLEVEVGESLRQSYEKLLFVSVITAMERYLSYTFINTVLDDPSLIRKVVESDPEFQKRKFTLNQLYEKMDAIKEETGKHLSGIIYHRLEKISRMYQSVLGVDFPKDIPSVYKAVKTRHDIVHRNGVDKDGKLLLLEDGEVKNLIDEIKKLVSAIDGQLNSG